MMKFRENEDAVSPVIGVILMVAITVILAAVIAAFVFGMAGDMDSQKEVYATAKISTNSSGNTWLIVTLQGGKDINLIKKVECIIGDEEAKPLIGLGGGDSDKIELGRSGKIDLSGEDLEDEYHILIRATFKDGSQKILVEMDHTYSAPT
jgi:flagellin-like protein